MRVQNAQGAGWGRELEAVGLREKVCFVLFEILHGRSLVRGIASWPLSEDLGDRGGGNGGLECEGTCR